MSAKDTRLDAARHIVTGLPLVAAFAAAAAAVLPELLIILLNRPGDEAPTENCIIPIVGH
jgi:hypothetical protein